MQITQRNAKTHTHGIGRHSPLRDHGMFERKEGTAARKEEGRVEGTAGGEGD